MQTGESWVLGEGYVGESRSGVVGFQLGGRWSKLNNRVDEQWLGGEEADDGAWG